MNKIILSVSDQAIVQDIVNQVYGVDILIVSTELITNDNTTYGWSAYYPKVYTTPWNTKVQRSDGRECYISGSNVQRIGASGWPGPVRNSYWTSEGNL